MIRIPSKPSKPVLEFATIAADARAMSKLITSYTSPAGKGPDQHYALHHSQYSPNPYNFFVINPRLVGAKDGEVCVVVNAKILEKKKETAAMSREACMSFPFRHGIKVRRYDTIRVSYQVPDEKGKELRTKEEEVHGLMAHIFQHENEHAQGRHIYLGTNSR